MTPREKQILPYNFWNLLSVFLISVVMIGLQLTLMRALSVARYYHFSYLVISTALLGFGASGTLLFFAYDWMKHRLSSILHLLFLIFLISVPGSYLLAQQLPIDIQYILLDARQRWLMLLYNFLIFIPFFLGATLIGFFITYFKRNVSRVYGANLLGSGAGGVLALLIMFWIRPTQLPILMTFFVFLGYASWLYSSFSRNFSPSHRLRSILLLLLALLTTVASMMVPSQPHIDPHKNMAQMKRLENQGDARHLLQRYGPRGQIDIYDSPAVHYTLFAGLQSNVLPPPQLSLLIDGSMAGTIFQISRQDEAAILDYTPQSLPYRLVGDSARVLLLGASGGTNIWLARRYDARHITVVQTNPQLVSIMKNELSDKNGRIYNRSNVQVVTQSPRHYLEQSDQSYDIIHFVRSESMAAGTGGLQSLSENFLLTPEAIQEAYGLLANGGFISITRGIETPPRDNIKIFALFHRALEMLPRSRPSKQLLQSRNYLAVNTLLHKTPIPSKTLQQYRSITDSLLMDNDYYPGIQPTADESYNEIGGPEDAPYSWYFHAAKQILGDQAEAFYSDWVYNVRPPTDNRPYFSNFFKWSSLERFRQTYGKFWLQKVELGFVVLAITFGEITFIAFLLILLPLIIRRQVFANTGHSLKTLLYFTATGLGFIFLEMVFIQKFGRFMGDPIYSTGAALTSMLVFAGLGSIIQQNIRLTMGRKILAAGASLILVTVLYIFFLDQIFEAFSDLPTIGRFFITILLLFPPAFSLGWLFPIGIELLNRNAPSLIPWAWGIDGFTSVVGAPLALMLSMTYGFNTVLLIGLGIYGLLMATVPFWPKKGIS